jgi:hypothetical protein
LLPVHQPQQQRQRQQQPEQQQQQGFRRLQPNVGFRPYNASSPAPALLPVPAAGAAAAAAVAAAATPSSSQHIAGVDQFAGKMGSQFNGDVQQQQQHQPQKQQQQQQGTLLPEGVHQSLLGNQSPLRQQFQAGNSAQAAVEVQVCQGPVGQDVTSLNPEKKRKILQQFDELQEVYLSSRFKKGAASNQQQLLDQQQQLGFEEAAPHSAAAAGAAAAAAAAANRQQMDDGDGASSRLQQQQQQQPPLAARAAAVDTAVGGLDDFAKVLSAVTSYNSLQPVAYIPPSAAGHGGSGSSANANILSSIEFDCLGRLFAVAGEFG